MNLPRKLPLELPPLLLRCESCGGCLAAEAAEAAETPARYKALGGAAEDAAAELLRSARAAGWELLADGEAARCPGCCGSGRRAEPAAEQQPAGWEAWERAARYVLWWRCDGCPAVGQHSELLPDPEHPCGRDECPRCHAVNIVTCCYATEEDAEDSEHSGVGGVVVDNALAALRPLWEAQQREHEAAAAEAAGLRRHVKHLLLAIAGIPGDTGAYARDAFNTVRTALADPAAGDALGPPNDQQPAAAPAEEKP